MKEFKVGDRVRCRSRDVCPSRDKPPQYTRQMEFDGIAEVTASGMYIRLADTEHIYRPEWLELVEDEITVLRALKEWLGQCIIDSDDTTYTLYSRILTKIADLEKPSSAVDWSKVEVGTLVAVSDDAASLRTKPFRKFLGEFNGYILVESPIDQSPIGYKYGRVL